MGKRHRVPLEGMGDIRKLFCAGAALHAVPTVATAVADIVDTVGVAKANEYEQFLATETNIGSCGSEDAYDPWCSSNLGGDWDWDDNASWNGGGEWESAAALERDVKEESSGEESSESLWNSQSSDDRPLVIPAPCTPPELFSDAKVVGTADAPGGTPLHEITTRKSFLQYIMQMVEGADTTDSGKLENLLLGGDCDLPPLSEDTLKVHEKAVSAATENFEKLREQMIPSKIDEDMIGAHEKGRYNAAKQVIRGNKMPCKGSLCNYFYKNKGTPQEARRYDMMSGPEQEKFKIDWCQKLVTAAECKYNTSRKYSHIEVTTGKFWNLGQLIIEQGGWGDPQAIVGALRCATMCLAMGGGWKSIHPQTARRLYKLLSFEDSTRFEESWEEFKKFIAAEDESDAGDGDGVAADADAKKDTGVKRKGGSSEDGAVAAVVKKAKLTAEVVPTEAGAPQVDVDAAAAKAKAEADADKDAEKEKNDKANKQDGKDDDGNATGEKAAVQATRKKWAEADTHVDQYCRDLLPSHCVVMRHFVFSDFDVVRFAGSFVIVVRPTAPSMQMQPVCPT